MNFLRARGKWFFLGGLPGMMPMHSDEHDIISKDNKTYKSYLQRPPNTNETGWERLKEIFKIDEFGTISPELNSIYQAGFVGLLSGVVYGGIIQSRQAYFNFIENNQATAFKSHLDAKSKLQNDFTLNFAKGGFKWGWRVALLTTSYYGISTLISVYRGKSSIYEYLAAGTLSGAMYKFSMGLRGMAAGGIVGGVLGGLGGAATLLILHLSGTSMEEVRYWHYKWRVNRDAEIEKTYKMAAEKEEPTPPLLKAHDARVGVEISLESIK